MSRSQSGDPSSTPRRTHFRPDIQGLRAVAVLLVIASHYGLPGADGGYIGVDVFFVISGYLISQLLFREVSRSGKLSLGNFYARRARRILPAASLVLVFTVAAASALLSAVEARNATIDAMWSTVFAANVRFAAVGADYFAKDQSTSPLQHYWSLAVEEQFYLFWPLVLIATLLASRRWWPRGVERVPKRLLAPLLVAIIVASFAWSLHAAASSANAAYFSAPGRVWELALGALLALLGPRLISRTPSSARGVLAFAGLGAIAVACLSPGVETRTGPVALLLPVVGSAAVLIAGSGAESAHWGPQRVLGSPPLRHVGDWSFSLYLWHWPLLILAEGHAGRIGVGGRLALVVATFVLAYLTYRFVESPFRVSSRLSPRRALLLYPGSVSLLALTCGFSVVYGQYQIGAFGNERSITVAASGILDDASVRVSNDPRIALTQASVYAAQRGAAIPSRLNPGLLDLDDEAISGVGECDYSPADERRLCRRGDVDADRTIVVLGDSHARMWISAFEQIAQRQGYATYYLVKPLCTAADLIIGSANDSTDGSWPDCSDFRDWAFDQIAQIRPDLTVVASAAPTSGIFAADQRLTGAEERPQLLTDGWERTLDTLAPLSDDVALLRDVPWANRSPGPCLTQRDHDLSDCLFTPVRARERDAAASARAARARGVTIVNPRPWLCWRGDCAWVAGGTITYTDSNHLTAAYAATLAPSLRRALGISMG